ncbi:MAG TPA: hypothetical protein VKW08_08030 [Xanthobacteraceae bacterium]|nr:hypothetical protein [Xanthobacteraceae bacterium]
MLGEAQREEQLTISEPAGVPEIWFDAVAWIYDKGDSCRIVLYSEDRPLGPDGPLERRIVAKLVGPSGSLFAIVEAITNHLARRERGANAGRLLS